MTEKTNYCMGCMKEIPTGTEICPHCSYNALSVQKEPFLEKRSVIAERYLIGKVEAFSSDSISYIALDMQENKTVSVIEFYPEKIVSRSPVSSQIGVRMGYDEMFRVTLQSFLDLYNDLKELSAIVCMPKVCDILLFNSTAYAVCEYKDCITLESYFGEKPPLSPKKALSAFRPVISALGKLHAKGIVHGNISPKSLCVGSDGKIHLTRFTIKQCYGVSGELRGRPASGFTPIELYGDAPALTPAADIYGITALIYYAITGKLPTDATKRAVKDDMILPSAVAEKLTKNEIGAIIKGLAVEPANRCSSIRELSALLYPAAKKPSQTPPVPPQSRSTAQKSPTKKLPSQEVMAKVKKLIPETPKAPSKPVSEKTQAINDLAPMMIKIFVSIVAGLCLLLCVLYTTVLYKSFEIPIMDKMFSSISFLPMNQDNSYNENEDIQSTSPDTPVGGDLSYVSVPDFTVHTYDSIQSNEVFNRNFVITYKFKADKNYEKDTVISQSLTAGESVISGTKITLVISEGMAQIELPDVIGMSYQTAKEKLEHAGFEVKQELSKNNGSETPDEVYMMSKVAGLEFDEGTLIVLSVWDEVEETTTEETTTKPTTTKPTTTKPTTTKATTTTKASQ